MQKNVFLHERNVGTRVSSMYTTVVSDRKLASFPGPTQLFVAITPTLFCTASDEKLGGAWERG